ncbi:MAG TPA: ABC transporter ATP-binding protein, partial [Polyangiaceae bacterium]
HNDLLRFDLSRSALFSGIAAQLNRHLSARRSEPGDSDGPGRAVDGVELSFSDLIEKHRQEYCDGCGRHFPPHTRVCPFCLQRGRVLGRVLGYAGRYKRQIMVMGSLMVLGIGVELLQPQLMRILIDDVLVTRKRADWLPLVVLGLASIMAIEHLLGAVRGRLGVWVGSHVTNNIQLDAFNHLQRLSLSYFNRQQTGTLMSRLSNDARQMQGFLVDGIQFTVINLLMVIGVSSMLIVMNPVLGCLVLLPMPVVVLVSSWVWPRLKHRFRILWASTAAVSRFLSDVLTGVRVVKAFGQEPAEIKRYELRLERMREHLISAENTWQTLIPALNFIVQSSVLLVWYFGAFEVFVGRLTVGKLVAYIAYLGMMFGPLQLLTRLNDWLGRSLTAAARVFEILDTEAQVKDKPGAIALPSIRGQVSLSQVTFGYEPHNPVLKDISLEIKPGEMVGLVGPSGAGKSTTINLVGRLYDVDQGAIRIDGHDVRDLLMDDLRRQIGYVLQEPFLFSGSVAENIGYARATATQMEIIEAAIAANAHEFIMNLPDGYDTLVGERGQRLSGGERQRISIARAILADPKILILDEATASVDTETEMKIQLALRKLIQGRTTLAIAHRLSTLRHASRLVVLEQGKVVEEGTHAELMAKPDGVYQRLVNIQSEWSRTIAVGG